MSVDAIATIHRDGYWTHPAGRDPLFPIISGAASLQVCNVEIARQLERELAEARAELAKLRRAVDLAARAMGGEGVNDQGEAWDKCLRILDEARADFPEDADK